MLNRFTKIEIATAVTVFFHGIGLAGLLFSGKDFFLAATPLNLLLAFVLLLWTQEQKNMSFLFFLVICFSVGILVEIIGTNTGMLFGNYVYGTVLGYQIKNVPVIIGINWFIIIYCCGISVQTLLTTIVNRVSANNPDVPRVLKLLSVIVDGATLAVFFDWLMEPVAVKLGFWIWKGSGEIPVYNYVCWFIVSLLLLTVFHFAKFSKHNKFAVNLLLVQMMFFLLLRTFLK